MDFDADNVGIETFLMDMIELVPDCNVTVDNRNMGVTVEKRVDVSLLPSRESIRWFKIGSQDDKRHGP